MPDPNKGLLSRAWDWANQGLIGGDTILRAVTPGSSDWSSTKQMRREAYDPTSDMSQLKRFALGASADTIDTISSFTSPISLALFGTGALGKAAPAASRLGQIVRGLETVAGGGMAAHGGVQAGQNAGDMFQNGATPDNVRGVLGGLGSMAGGYAGMLKGLDGLFLEPAPSPRLANVTSIENSREFVRPGTPEVPLSAAEKGLLNQNVAPKQRGPQLVPDPQVEVSPGLWVRQSRIAKAASDPAAYGDLPTSASPEVISPRGLFNDHAVPDGVTFRLTEPWPGTSAVEMVHRTDGVIGKVLFSNTTTPGEAMVKWSEVDPRYRSRLLGVEAYRQAMEHAQKLGYKAMRSDDLTVSPDAHQTWQSMSSVYPVESLPDGYRLRFDDIGKKPATNLRTRENLLTHTDSFLRMLLGEPEIDLQRTFQPPPRPSFIEATDEMVQKMGERQRQEQLMLELEGLLNKPPKPGQ